MTISAKPVACLLWSVPPSNAKPTLAEVRLSLNKSAHDRRYHRCIGSRRRILLDSAEVSTLPGAVAWLLWTYRLEKLVW
jgi:hypothetical protein